ncbi:MAG: hypothetical protein O2983_12140, partial [Planctomycetota bacterium]|nr:hypothetical protein [Planctomycetota bacterium]
PTSRPSVHPALTVPVVQSDPVYGIHTRWRFRFSAITASNCRLNAYSCMTGPVFQAYFWPPHELA